MEIIDRNKLLGLIFCIATIFTIGISERVTIYDEAGNGGAIVDASSSTLVTISHDEHALHEGALFFKEGCIELDDTDTFFIKIQTPSDVCNHISWIITSSGITTTKLYETATGGMTGGSVSYGINANRCEGTPFSLTEFTSGVTNATSYVYQVSYKELGSESFKSNVGGETTNLGMILKEDSTYLREFVSGSDANKICFSATWHEEV